MKTILGVALMPLCLLVVSSAYSGKSEAASKGNIQLYFNGAPQGNSGANPPAGSVFTNWCGTTCFPTTEFPLLNQTTGETVGKARVWGKDMVFSADGETLCFTEFIEYQLKKGSIYTLGRAAGTCGTYMDSALVPAMNVQGAEVLAGGGDGSIVGGTGKYKDMTGTYNDRVFVEFMNRSSIVYYDALFFNLMPDDPKGK